MSDTETTDVVETTEAPVVETPAVKEPKIRDQTDAIKELRKENEKLRKTMHELSGTRAEELAELKLAALRAETEESANRNAEALVSKKIAEIEEANRAKLVRSELKSEAHKAGVADFADLYEIMKKDHLGKVEFDNDGEVANAASLIAEMKQSKPHLFVQANTSSNAATPSDRMTNNVDVRSLSDADFSALLRQKGVRIPGVS